MQENIRNSNEKLTEKEKEIQEKILARLAGLQGHWEGRELVAYKNRLADVEDDLPFFR